MVAKDKSSVGGWCLLLLFFNDAQVIKWLKKIKTIISHKMLSSWRKQRLKVLATVDF